MQQNNEELPSDWRKNFNGSWVYTLVFLQLLAAISSSVAIGLITFIRSESGLPLVDDMAYVGFVLFGISSIFIGIMVLFFRKKLLVVLFVLIEILFFLLFVVLFFKLTLYGEMKTIRSGGDLNGHMWAFGLAVRCRIAVLTF